MKPIKLLICGNSGFSTKFNDLWLIGFKKLIKPILVLIFLGAFGSTAWAQLENVKTHNAFGDGSTDDSLAIQAAVDALPSTGGTVYFPPGIYNVSRTIVIPSDVRVQGMGSLYYNCQIRLTVTGIPIFQVGDGASNVIFKDLTLVGKNFSFTPDTAAIRTAKTAGISLKADSLGIENIEIENVRIVQVTYGISAVPVNPNNNSLITDVKIRNYASESNEYSLHTKTTGADDWDVQNMNVFPMFVEQNGIFLERSGDMKFLQLSCASAPNAVAGVCAKLLDNGDTYFRQMHVEGPRLGLCVGSKDCDGEEVIKPEPNSSVITMENSAAAGEFYRVTKIISMNNRIWINFPGIPIVPIYTFIGDGEGSSLLSCANVWVSWDPNTHRSDTTVNAPTGAFPGLNTTVQGCREESISTVPAFNQGYVADIHSLPSGLNNADGEANVLDFGANTAPGNDDTQAFIAAINALTTTGSTRKRVYIPDGVYDIKSTLLVNPLGPNPPAQHIFGGVSFVGESKNVIIRYHGSDALFKITAYPHVVRGISFRNLVLESADGYSSSNPIGILMESESTVSGGGASDFHIQNVDFKDFGRGISVQPIGDVWNYAHPMFDSVSVKDAVFDNNKTAIVINSNNASHWNLENITVNIPNGEEGIRVNGAGHLNIRDLSCDSSGTGLACVSVQRQNGLAIDNMSADNVTNALFVRWENGWTQFPVTIRNSDLRAGVYFQGRIYLNSVNNIFPFDLTSIFPIKEVKFGAVYEGNPLNDSDSYGGMSDIFSCNDTFEDVISQQTQSTWIYSGTLTKSITYCN